jgi:hypothetical protein
MADVSTGIFDVPRFERRVMTVGANYFPHPHVVVKADWSRRTFGDDQINDEDTISIDLGFSTSILGDD